jgi:glycerol-3-phosphate dehydrogenase (NAD(P)+)
VDGKDLLLFAVPSSAVAEVAQAIQLSTPQMILSAAKGLQKGTDRRMSEILSERFPQSIVGSLSGPSFAFEVIQLKPTALTLAAQSLDYADKLRAVVHSETLRVYTSSDLIGVELGGTIKNVIAIAAGIVDGAGIGVNARAALLTRGLAEMSRLVVAAGGRAETAMGLSGMGDLILTATSDLSRNRRVGLALGRGGDLQTALKEIGQVSEGAYSAEQVVDLSKRHNVAMPVCQEVLKLLEGKTTVQQSVKGLLSRAPTSEGPVEKCRPAAFLGPDSADAESK